DATAAAAAREDIETFLGAVPERPQHAAYTPARWPAMLDVFAGAATPTLSEFSWTRSEFHERPLPPDAITNLLDLFQSDRRAGESRELDFSPWAGAYTDLPTDATAFPHRMARFLLKHSVTLHRTENGSFPSDSEHAGGWVTRSWALAHPHGTGGVYPN